MRQECTEENPYFYDDNKTQWFHPKAIKRNSEDVYTEWYDCPVCGKLFGVTVSD